MSNPEENPEEEIERPHFVEVEDDEEDIDEDEEDEEEEEDP